MPLLLLEQEYCPDMCGISGKSTMNDYDGDTIVQRKKQERRGKKRRRAIVKTMSIARVLPERDPGRESMELQLFYD